MAEYWRNLCGILTKNGPARPAEILGLNGPAQLKFGPERPGPAQFVYNPTQDTVAFGLECPQSDPNGENFRVQCFCFNQAAWDGFPGETDLPIEDCMGTPSNNLVQTYHGYQGTNQWCNGPYLENGKGLGGGCRNMIRLTC